MLHAHTALAKISWCSMSLNSPANASMMPLTVLMPCSALLSCQWASAGIGSRIMSLLAKYSRASALIKGPAGSVLTRLGRPNMATQDSSNLSLQSFQEASFTLCSERIRPILKRLPAPTMRRKWNFSLFTGWIHVPASSSRTSNFGLRVSNVAHLLGTGAFRSVHVGQLHAFAILKTSGLAPLLLRASNKFLKLPWPVFLWMCWMRPSILLLSPS